MSKSGLHIAHFTNTYFPVMSGVVRSISTFRQAQEELGHTVFIFGQEASDYADEEPFVFRYPSINIPIRNYPATIPVSNYIDWVLPKLKLDVIHAHHPALMGNAAADKCEKLNIPLVFTHHTR
jgi:1,2-diacylglycerol 3-alpha-glucosyltransferase